MTEWTAFDLALALAIVWLAWTALSARETFTGIVLFMVMGLTLAVAWVRLGATDVALAEAAVGAGVTGALLLRAWATRRTRGVETGATGLHPVPALLSVAVAGLLLWAMRLPSPGPRLEGAVSERLSESGVENPVTAVLLNFRAYDTMLEVLVLFAAIALVGHLALGAGPVAPRGLGRIFRGFLRCAGPPLVVVAGYLLWIGASEPGGAFQAGAVLGAAGILLSLDGGGGQARGPGAAARVAFVLGVGGFGIAAVLGWAMSGTVLEYPAQAAKAWIVAIEILVAVSTAATLAGLFHGLAGHRRRA